MSNIYRYIIYFLFFFCQDTTIYVPLTEPNKTKHGSIDTERTVVISIGSTIIVVLILLILLHLSKKPYISCTRTGELSAPDDVYETINAARIHQLQAMIDRMCLCCLSVPNNEDYALHHL